jgi:hypothetical protein
MQPVTASEIRPNPIEVGRIEVAFRKSQDHRFRALRNFIQIMDSLKGERSQVFSNNHERIEVLSLEPIRNVGIIEDLFVTPALASFTNFIDEGFFSRGIAHFIFEKLSSARLSHNPVPIVRPNENIETGGR